MAIYDVHYADRRTSLVLEADLNAGWRRLEKTYGFNQQRKVPFSGDLSIRAQLTIIAQPASFDAWASEFPSVELEQGDEHISYRLRNKHLVVKVALVPGQPWRMMSTNRPGLYIEELAFVGSGGHWYDLRAWIVFHEPSHRPIPDVRVWTESVLVVPGGRVESNRQRH